MALSTLLLADGSLTITDVVDPPVAFLMTGPAILMVIGALLSAFGYRGLVVIKRKFRPFS